MNTISQITLSLALLALTGACSAQVTTGDGSDQGGAGQISKPVPTCVDLNGQWQMNSDNFTLTQVGCSALNWHDNTAYTNPYDHTFIADGITRAVPTTDGTIMHEASVFKSGMFILDRVVADANGNSVQREYQFYLTKTPCQLQNPDGSDYLTMATYDNSSNAPTSCTFWRKQ